MGIGIRVYGKLVISWYSLKPIGLELANVKNSKKNNILIWGGVISLVVPSMIVAGFIPGVGLLPVPAWVCLAGIGTATAFAIGTNRRIPAAISGFAMGAGGVIGLLLYVMARTALSDDDMYFQVELLLGMLLGLAPGGVLYMHWALEE
ncbi:MAG: hypothetical protein KDA66_05200 [Planctomycetaceae bacterium]|nr:hypothetical protein [Planctomycetaceae bacterium]